MLQWYFGSQVELNYHYREDAPEGFTVLVNGQNPFRDGFKADRLIAYLEGLGLKRVDRD